ncbi:MAG: lipase/acyltransferase domain-containing protein, partial [Aestuariivirga sp.]
MSIACGQRNIVSMERQFFLFFLGIFLVLAQAARADEPSPMSSRELAELRQLVNPADHIAIVFIPGILGSKLTVDGKEVWGGVFNFEPELVYDPSKPASAEVFDKVEVNAIFKKFGFNVYGNAIQDLRDEFTDASTNIFVFPYDWRQSNTLTASRLNELLCVIAEQNGKSGGHTSFIVAAHSMGGLVLKYWLGNYWDKGGDCPGFKLTEKANVERLFFLGTPHVGATKFVESLIDDYKLGEGNEWFGRLLASGLNKYGASFESVYELLPIFQSERCRLATVNGANLPQYVFMKVDSKPRPIDIFDQRRWRDLGIPKQLPPLPGGENYYETFLPRQLGRAEEMLCGMMQNGYGREAANSVFLYGRTDMPNTIDAIVLTRYRNSTVYS